MRRVRTTLRALMMVFGVVVGGAVVPAAASAAGGWAPVPAELVAPGPTVTAPVGLAFGPDGALTAAWLQGGGAADLMVAERPAGGSWNLAQRISGGASVTGVAVASNPSGAQALAWLEGGYVRAATRAAGGTWQAVAVPLSGPGIGGAPVLAVAPDGTVAVAWLDAGVVKVSVRGVAGAFSAATTVASGTDPHALAIAAGPGSDIMLVWADTNGAQSRIMASYRAAGGPSFAAAVSALTVAPGNPDQAIYLNVPKVVFDSGGEASVVWLRVVTNSVSDTTLSVWEGKWRTAGSGGTFQGVIPHGFENRTVNDTLPSPLYDGKLVADASGRTSFAWPSLGSAGELGTAMRTAGTGFAATQNVPAPSSPRIAAAAAGSSLLVTEDKTLTAAFAPPGGGLGAFDVALSPSAATTQNRTVPAGDALGDAAVLWGVRDAGNAWALRVSTYDVTPPEARAVDVPSGAVVGAGVGMSVTPWDALTGASATWDFGDGSPVVSGSSVSHVYADAGARTVTVTVTDGAGNTAVATRPIHVSAVPAPLPGPPPPAVKIRDLKLSPATFRARKSARVSYTVNTAATVRFTVERGASGRTVGGKCVKPSKANKKRKPCVRWTKVGGTVTTRTVKAAGGDRFTFKARVGSTRLRPGRYQLVATPTGRGTPASASFTIVR
jgi:hypothetical protein